MNVLVLNRTGEALIYSLIAFSPREDVGVTFNGDRGWLECNEFIGLHMNRAVPGTSRAPKQSNLLGYSVSDISPL